MHALQRYFQDHIPEQGPARVARGDYFLHNTLIGEEGAVVAVIDLELAGLGDPLSDFAFALGQWYEPGDPPEAIAARYASRTGRDLSKLDFYIGFNQC